MNRKLFILGSLLLAGVLPVRAQLLASGHRYATYQNRESDTRQLPLRTALSELERHYNVSFIYPTNLVDTKVTLGDEKYPNLESELTKLLANKGLTYRKVQPNFYAIVPVNEKSPRIFRKIEQIETKTKASPEPEIEPVKLPIQLVDKLENSGWSMSSTKPLADISGKVTDKNGQGIPGVSVVIKGTNRGTNTSGAGEYSLNANNNATLVFSFVGYVSQEVPVSGRSRINVTLLDDVKALSEVVVVGYGTQKRANITGAIASVSSQDIAQLPVPSVESALQGRVAGVQVTNNGGPGQTPIVRIRGIGSINYAANPLYVIDGYPTSDLNNFDTHDIESVDVLKDASAAAIYGSRAANGVIIITTKHGRTDGKLHVSYDGYVGSQTAWKTLSLLNRDQYIQYATALLTNAGAALPTRFANLNQPVYAGATQTYAQTDTDWQKAVFRTAPITQHSISLSGGNEKSRFYSSFGYFNQQGIMIGTNYRRGNFRINSDHTISKRFTFGQTLAISYGDQYQEVEAGGRTQIQNMIRMPSYLPVTDPILLGGYRGPDGSDGQDAQNPVRAALQDRSNLQTMKILSSAYLDVNLLPGLTYRIRGGIDYVTARTYSFQPTYNESFNARALANFSDSRYTYTSPLISNQLTYDQTFGEKHHLNVVAVAERQGGSYSQLGGAGNASSNSVQQAGGLISTSVGISGSLSQNVLISYLARASYEFNGKYLLGASFRRDGSSRFAPGNKWGTFPSVSAGWRISEEKFLKNVPAISELKLRASYGSMGFNGIGDYAWQVAVSQTTNAILGGSRTQGVYFDQLGNTNLRWEVTKMSNIGLDLGLFNNSLTLSAEVYDRRTDGLILNQPIAPSIGYTQSPIVNVGSMQNRGVELQLGYSKKTGAFTYNLSGNISLIRNKVLSLGQGDAPLFAGANADYGGYDITRTAVGEPIQSFYGWKTAGIFQSADQVKAAPKQANAAPGDIRFANVNGDTIIDANDRVTLGSFLPKFSYGFNANISYRNFDITAFFQGVQGNKIYNGTKVLTQGMLRLFNSGTDVLNAWTPTNTNTDVPRAVSGDPNGNTRTSDRFIESGSYLRLKNLSIGYSVPAGVLNSFTRGTLSRARVYVSATNLITITKYTGYDPEVGSRYGGTLTNGIDYGQFPQARTFMAGLQIGF